MTKEGQRVELVYTSDPHTNLKPGDQGTVFSVDSVGTVHINWDSGSNLGLIPGEDKWKEIQRKEDTKSG